VLALHDGNYEEAAKDKAEDRTGPPSFPTAGFFMLDCASDITPEREKELDNDPAVDLIGKPGAEVYQHACPVWDVDLGDDFRTGFEIDVPTVMVHGTWDLSTPLMNAERLQPAFTNGTLVPVKRGTHGAFWEARDASDVFAEGIDHFLRTGDRSQVPDTVTLPEVNWIVP
jgi:pimeloyl-ACP methyl ester carboxylesterase